jgi:hypothetical protein
MVDLSNCYPSYFRGHKRQQRMEKLQSEYAEEQEMDIVRQQIQLIQNKRKLIEEKQISPALPSKGKVTFNESSHEEDSMKTKFENPTGEDIKEFLCNAKSDDKKKCE